MAALLVTLLLYPAPRDPEPDPLAKGFVGVGLTENAGIVITRIVPNSPAAKAALQENDLILKINDTTVTSVSETAELIRRCRPGSVMIIQLRRAGQEMTCRIKVGARPADMP